MVADRVVEPGTLEPELDDEAAAVWPMSGRSMALGMEHEALSEVSTTRERDGP